jgi:hypothetical protein
MMKRATRLNTAVEVLTPAAEIRNSRVEAPSPSSSLPLPARSRPIIVPDPPLTPGSHPTKAPATLPARAPLTWRLRLSPRGPASNRCGGILLTSPTLRIKVDRPIMPVKSGNRAMDERSVASEGRGYQF